MLKLTPIIPLATTALTLGMLLPTQAANVIVRDVPVDDGTGTGATIDVPAVTRIRQLKLPLTGGDVYVDIFFRFDSFNTIFGDPTNPNPVPFFFNNPTDGQIALTEINAAINGVSPIPQYVAGGSTQYPQPEPLASSDYVFPLSYNNITGEIQPLRGFFDGFFWTDAGISPIAPDAVNFYARFVQVKAPLPPAVPEPSSLIGLMVTGVSFLLMGKGKRN